MRISRTVTATAAVVALITVVCGGCSSSKKSTSAASPTTAATSAASPSGSQSAEATPTGSASPSPSAGAGGAAATVSATTVGKYQNILVDARGKTLYLFEADTSPTSTCYDACATAWPPALTTGTPTATDGVDQAKLSTSTRKDGTTQIVYNGHPLYYFEGDTAQGDTNGEESSAFGATWYVVNTSGNKVEGS
ncbi:COG4315 family predicted lipoprotein [Kitasatospora sp. NPDC054768]